MAARQAGNKNGSKTRVKFMYILNFLCYVPLYVTMQMCPLGTNKVFLNLNILTYFLWYHVIFEKMLCCHVRRDAPFGLVFFVCYL